MVRQKLISRLAAKSSGFLMGLSLMIVGSTIQAQELPAPDTPLDPTLEQPEVELGAPRILEQDSSVLSLAGGLRLLEEADQAIAATDYNTAQSKLQDARQVFNQLSNFYQQLSSTFAGINSRLSDEQRRSALETAQLRDRATYQLAIVHINQGQPELAMPLLVQVVRSQNPTSELGRQAYTDLVRVGLVQSAEVEVPPEAMVPEGLISFAGGETLLAEAETAISNADYNTATQKLQQSRQVFNQLSNFHQQLASSFAGINPDVSQDQRQRALRSAQLRDRATYQLALVHRAEGQPELSVPLLVQVVRSQNPNTDLGRRAYQQLVELGFVVDR